MATLSAAELAKRTNKIELYNYLIACHNYNQDLVISGNNGGGDSDDIGGEQGNTHEDVASPGGAGQTDGQSDVISSGEGASETVLQATVTNTNPSKKHVRVPFDLATEPVPAKFYNGM